MDATAKTATCLLMTGLMLVTCPELALANPGGDKPAVQVPKSKNQPAPSPEPTEQRADAAPSDALPPALPTDPERRPAPEEPIENEALTVSPEAGGPEQTPVAPMQLEQAPAASTTAPGALPSYDTVGPAPAYDEPLGNADQPAPMRKVPGNGNGLLAASGLAFAGGATMFVGTGLMAGAGYSSSDWGATLGLGIVGTMAGGVLLGTGLRRKRRYRAWEAKQVDREQIPASGSGMIAPGAMLIVVGATAGPVGTALTVFRCYEAFEGCDPSPV
ncbi:MAG: hypothetical protein KC457_30805, partial [Myxococcales bacterium]|nr:hypothetical protein [Myxococcales bacterium]